MDKIHDIFLVAEDSLLRVSARLVLFVKYAESPDQPLLHVFHVKQLEVYRIKDLSREILDWSFFLRMTHRSQNVLPSGSSFFFAPRNSNCWSEFTVDRDSTLEEVIEQKCTDIGHPREM